MAIKTKQPTELTGVLLRTKAEVSPKLCLTTLTKEPVHYKKWLELNKPGVIELSRMLKLAKSTVSEAVYRCKLWDFKTKLLRLGLDPATFAELYPWYVNRLTEDPADLMKDLVAGRTLESMTKKENASIKLLDYVNAHADSLISNSEHPALSLAALARALKDLNAD